MNRPSPELLNGNSFASLSEHIRAFEDFGIYFELDANSPPELLVGELLAVQPELDFESNCLAIIEDRVGKRLLADSSELAELRGMAESDYILELEDEGFRFINEAQPMMGLIREFDWLVGFVDPLGLEYLYRTLLEDELNGEEKDVLNYVFSKYRKNMGLPYKFPYELETDDCYYKTYDAWDFVISEAKSKDKRLARDAISKVMDRLEQALYSPFSERRSYEFSSDNCYFSIAKNYHYAAVFGLREGAMIDVCIYRGEN